MALDIFSSFDDHHKVNLRFYLIWAALPAILIFSDKLYPSFNNPFRKTAHGLLKKGIGGALSGLSVLLDVIICLNFIGLSPYIFSSTRHLCLNISLALPMWIAVILIRATHNFREFIAHLQPVGSPRPLNPFLVVIELVSLCVRPLTLLVRLRANLRAGHILIALLGGAFPSGSVFILIIGMLYFSFEMAVCVVQAYIFTLLSRLYLDEHPS